MSAAGAGVVREDFRSLTSVRLIHPPVCLSLVLSHSTSAEGPPCARCIGWSVPEGTDSVLALEVRGSQTRKLMCATCHRRHWTDASGSPEEGMRTLLGRRVRGAFAHGAAPRLSPTGVQEETRRHVRTSICWPTMLVASRQCGETCLAPWADREAPGYSEGQGWCS